MLGMTLQGDLTLSELKRIGKNLPFPPIIIDGQTKLYKELTKFEKEINEKYYERSKIEKAISSIQDTNDESIDYKEELIKIHSIQKDDIKEHSMIECPLCNNTVSEISDNLNRLDDSKNKLLEELEKLGAYSKDNTEIVTSFRLRKKKINNEISKISRNIT
ncbi:hypothetical protein P700755_003801 [Psychroflexus torquis ATCC 700755]|uniref:Uncharacterized protein n=2 Tax=Psychroflexus TaxID=83612 RepID=K4IKP7_PSYTT|nr:hypothetical protein P700755_003801 [Psychroflexus torquis ATCC 700755]